MCEGEVMNSMYSSDPSTSLDFQMLHFRWKLCVQMTDLIVRMGQMSFVMIPVFPATSMGSLP